MWRYTHDGSRCTNHESRPEYFQKYFFGAGLHVSSMRHILEDAAKHLNHQLLLLLKFALLLELLKFEAFPLEEMLRARMAELGGPCKQRVPCLFGIVFEHIMLVN